MTHYSDLIHSNALCNNDGEGVCVYTYIRGLCDVTGTGSSHASFPQVAVTVTTRSKDTVGGSRVKRWIIRPPEHLPQWGVTSSSSSSTLIVLQVCRCEVTNHLHAHTHTHKTEQHPSPAPLPPPPPPHAAGNTSSLLSPAELFSSSLFFSFAFSHLDDPHLIQTEEKEGGDGAHTHTHTHTHTRIVSTVHTLPATFPPGSPHLSECDPTPSWEKLPATSCCVCVCVCIHYTPPPSGIDQSGARAGRQTWKAHSYNADPYRSRKRGAGGLHVSGHFNAGHPWVCVGSTPHTHTHTHTNRDECV